MNRYCLEVIIDKKTIFYMEYRSITSVAKTIDRFFPYPEMWFTVYDSLKDRDISVEELMKIWHS